MNADCPICHKPFVDCSHTFNDLGAPSTNIRAIERAAANLCHFLQTDVNGPLFVQACVEIKEAIHASVPPLSPIKEWGVREAAELAQTIAGVLVWNWAESVKDKAPGTKTTVGEVEALFIPHIQRLIAPLIAQSAHLQADNAALREAVAWLIGIGDVKPYHASTNHDHPQSAEWRCLGCDGSFTSHWPKWEEPTDATFYHKLDCKYIKAVSLASPSTRPPESP